MESLFVILIVGAAALVVARQIRASFRGGCNCENAAKGCGTVPAKPGFEV